MAITERERNRRKFVGMLEDYGLTSAAAAELLHSSVARISSWRREETSAGSNPVPLWALELLRFKIDALKLPLAKKSEAS